METILETIRMIISFASFIAVIIVLYIWKYRLRTGSRSLPLSFDEQASNIGMDLKTVPDYALRNKQNLQGEIDGVPVYVACDCEQREEEHVLFSAHIPVALPYGLKITKAEGGLEREFNRAIVGRRDEPLVTGYPEIDAKLLVFCPMPVKLFTLLADTRLRNAMTEAFTAEPSIRILRNEVLIESHPTVLKSNQALRRNLLLIYGIANSFRVAYNTEHSQISSLDGLPFDAQGGVS
jgi:hypothetical protein